MSENLSIDEIIKRAEKIRAEAERQLADAERSLDEKAKTVIDDVDVDTDRVLENVARLIESEEDVKEFVPSKPPQKEKTQTVRFPSFKSGKKPKDADPDEDEDIKIAPPVSKNKAVRIDDEEDEDIRIAPDPSKTRRLTLDKKESDTRVSPVRRKKDSEHMRPVILSTKSEKADDTDLEAIPTIVSHDNIDRVFDHGNSGNYQEEIGVQMSFEGFDDAVETVPTIDEEVAEQILEQRRQEKVGKFRLFGPYQTDKELGDQTVVKDDFVNRDDKKQFYNRLVSRKSRINVQIIATFFLGVPLLLMTLFRDKPYFPVFLSGHIAYFTTALVLFVCAIAVNIKVIVHGFNFKRGINSDFPIAILTLFTLVHTIVLLVNDSLWIDNGILLCSAACFGLFMSQLGKRQMMVRIIDNFEYISDGDAKYTVENIANAVDAGILSRGIVDDDEPIIKTSVHTDLPTNFMEISYKNDPADNLSRVLFPISIVFSFILLVVVALLDNIYSGINVAVAAFAVSTPVAGLFLTNDMLYDISVALDKYGSRVCGYEGAVMAGDSHAMVMEAADLFGKHGCDLHGIKTFNGAKVDDAIIQAAAVIIQSNGPLAHVFDDVIIGKQSILPKVEGIVYEEKMGTSAWIYQRKVLVGNRDLLIRHNVSVPKESFEQKYTRKGRKALYLAVGGNIVAMFVVSYSADPDLKRELRKLEKSGISIIVKSCDPYINEQSLSQLFGLPEGYIHVMDHSSARIFDKYSNMSVEKSPAYIVHDGTALGFVSAMRGAGVALSSKKLISFLVCFGCVLGFVAVALLAVIKGYSQITTINIIAFQTIWNLFVLAVSKLRRVGI